MTDIIARSAILAALLFAAAAWGKKMDAQAHIQGTVTNFANEPLAGAEVLLKRDDFSDVARAVADSQGNYSMQVQAGRYNALCAVRDYQVKNLEFWAWDVQAYGDVKIDCRVGGLELYGIHAWQPSGAAPSYLVYVRPMSLAKVTAAFMAAGSMEALGKLPVLDIAPELSSNDIEVTVDGEKVDVLQVNKVREAAGPNQYMYGYVIQTNLPRAKQTGEHSVFDIVLTDPKSGEKGEGCLFMNKQ